jgi:hypothetical protein
MPRNPIFDTARGADDLLWRTMQRFRLGHWQTGCRPSDVMKRLGCTYAEAGLTLKLLDSWGVVTRRDRDGRYFKKEEQTNAA